MTTREGISTLLQGGTPDRVPWFGDLSYWAAGMIGRGEQPKDFYQGQAYVDWHRDLGIGFYLQGEFPFEAIPAGYEIRSWEEGLLRCREIITPKGTLREVQQLIPESYTLGYVEHLVKSAEDLPAYRYVHEHTSYVANYGGTKKRNAEIGEAGLSLAFLPKSPLMQLIALDAGIMAVTQIAMLCPEEFSATIEAVKESHDRAAALALDCPTDILMIPENLSGEMVPRPWFDAWMRPYQRHWSERIRAKGIFSCIHMDGTLRGLLKEESAVGLTFIEAMTPSPVGDLAVSDWADFSGNDNVIFWGGLPGSYFSPNVPDPEFDRHVIETLEIMRREPRYVLGVADQVPPDGLESRVRRVGELVEEYGRY
jgi:hypothetical protein